MWNREKHCTSTPQKAIKWHYCEPEMPMKKPIITYESYILYIRPLWPPLLHLSSEIFFNLSNLGEDKNGENVLLLMHLIIGQNSIYFTCILDNKLKLICCYLYICIYLSHTIAETILIFQDLYSHRWPIYRLVNWFR